MGIEPSFTLSVAQCLDNCARVTCKISELPLTLMMRFFEGAYYLNVSVDLMSAMEWLFKWCTVTKLTLQSKMNEAKHFYKKINK